MFLSKCYILLTTILITTGHILFRHKSDDYWASREKIIQIESSQELGASIQLNDQEKLANEILMSYKLHELDTSFEDPSKYIPSRHFFDTKSEVEQSQAFSFLRELPKGGLLHTHDTATTSWEFLYEQTYLQDLYLCNDTDQPSRLRFFNVPDDTCNWALVQNLRDQGGEAFETFLTQQLTLVRSTHEQEFTDVNKVWNTFQNIFIFVTDMLTYRPVFENQFYRTLQELYNDNITYLEFRGTLPPVYDLTGKIYAPEETVDLYVQVLKRFQLEHPKFIGAKLIYAPLRNVEDKTIEEYITIAKSVKQRHPNFVAGFDFVGQEDLGRPLIDFIDKLESLDFDFFFHAGETNWNQGLTDQNLIDAILLGSKRLGHAYALIKHPELMKIVKERQIAIEVSPISNQVLCLVKDLRNHPGSIYLANNMPMVITNDDPTYWGAEGVSYDWYMAFMGMASRTADLKLLKQLAINSLEFTAMNRQEKEIAMQMWEVQWNQMINNFVSKQNTK